MALLDTETVLYFQSSTLTLIFGLLFDQKTNFLNVLTYMQQSSPSGGNLDFTLLLKINLYPFFLNVTSCSSVE